MATQYSNKPIVTDGLVYALDFGNPKSYVSGSTTANSLIYRPVPAKFETLLPGDYGTLAAAYSVRKVVSNYTGSAMMVQSASVSQSIGFDVDGNLDTASLESFAGSGDAFVKIWYDQSENGRHVSQSVAANQPQIVNNGNVIVDLANKPSLKFSGQQWIFNSSSFSYPQPFTNFTTVRFISVTIPSGNQYIWRNQLGNDSNLTLMGINGGRHRINAGSEIYNTNSVNNTNLLLYGLFNGNSSILGINNTYVTGNAGTNGLVNGITFGTYNGGFNLNGFICESIFYNSDQSSNRTKIEDSINRYFNIFTPTLNPIPDPDNDFLDFTNDDILQTQQSFPGFSYDQGNSTIMYVGETKGNSTTFTQDGTLSIVSTTSSVGFGSPSNNFGRSYPVTGLKHVTIRFSSGSVDCFINGLPVSASAVFPTGSFIGGGQLNIPLYTGSLGSFQVYNRPLTSDEIWNNYQLAAPRYELGPLQNKPYNLDENAYLFLQSAGITDPIITSSIDTFVRGLKSNNLWDKMIAIYPFVGTGSAGTNLTGSHRWNLKEPSLVTYPLSFTGSWIGSTSGSAPSGSNTNISVNGITPSQYYPFFNTQSAHISILSYDTPVSSLYLMGTGMTEDLAISTLAGDYGTPAAAYSVRKVRTAYSGALMDVRRDYDNVTSSIGFVSNGDLDTGSLLSFVKEYSQSFTVTVENDGVGNVFVLDGTQKPPLTLFRGGVYTFNQSDATNTTHPIAFKSGSESYTTGVVSTGTPGEAGAQTVFTVANDAPDDLSYYCTVHGDYMGNTITVIENTGSGFVARWYDQSGNNRHAVQTATGLQPLIVESGSLIFENGKPCLKFDGVDDKLQTATFTTLNIPYTTFLVNEHINFPGFPYIVDHASQRGIIGTVGTTRRIFNGNTLNYGDSSVGLFELNYGLFNGASSQAAVNGGTASVGDTGTSGFNRITLGSQGQATVFDNTQFSGYIWEYVGYNSNQSSNRGPIEYNINNYYNIYPQTSSFATSSFTIKTDSTSISGSLNNKLTSGIQSSGPLGLVTVSRTGSNSLTIARNGASTSFAVPASGALSTGIYLGAINNNGLALGNSPLNISFASVGTGLTEDDYGNYTELINNFQVDLTRPRLSDIIVTDGLVMYLDTANTASYPGTGGSIYNLLNLTSAQTLIGSNYSYNDINKTIRFDNSTTNNNGLRLISLSNITTVSLWYRQFSTLSGRYLLDMRTGGGGGFIWTGGFGSNWSSGALYKNGVSKAISWSNVETLNQWQNITVVANTPATDDMNIFTSFANSDGLDVEFAILQVWNRALTPSEVLNNYRGTKHRFGI